MCEADVPEIALEFARQIRVALENELTPLLRRYRVEMLPALDVHELTQKKTTLSTFVVFHMSKSTSFFQNRGITIHTLLYFISHISILLISTIQ